MTLAVMFWGSEPPNVTSTLVFGSFWLACVLGSDERKGGLPELRSLGMLQWVS